MLHGTKSRGRGSSLIEILISIFILMTSLLGFSAMQLESMQSVSLNQVRFRAVQIATSIADSLRANPLAVQEGYYDGQVKDSQARDCQSLSCSPKELANWDRKRWHIGLEVLPEGLAIIRREPTEQGSRITVSICWDENASSALLDCSSNEVTSAGINRYQLEILL